MLDNKEGLLSEMNKIAGKRPLRKRFCFGCKKEVRERKQLDDGHKYCLECSKQTHINYQGTKELPDDMTGHIVFWNEGLQCGIYPPERKTENGTVFSVIPMGYVTCYYMRVEGGFGAKKGLIGRMLIGKFFRNLEDVKNNKVATEGNTKCYPDGYIPELFEEVKE